MIACYCVDLLIFSYIDHHCVLRLGDDQKLAQSNEKMICCEKRDGECYLGNCFSSS